MSKKLELVRIIGADDQKTLADVASYVARVNDDTWFANAAMLVATGATNGTPFSHHAYDTALGIGYDFWHIGGDTMAIYYGQADKIEPYANLTENERESLLLAMRKELAAGHQLFALAHRTFRTKKNPTPATLPEPSSLTFDGALVVRYRR